MRSIRRSLVIYFLALMALVLGAAGYFIDREAGHSLEARETAVLALIDNRYSEAAHEEREKLDSDLAALAHGITNDVQMQYYSQERDRFTKYQQQMRLAPLGSLMAGMAPLPVAVPMWLQIGDLRTRSNSVARLNETLARSYFSHLQLKELPSVEEGQFTDFVQVTVQAVPNDRMFRSHTLEGEKWEVKQPTFESSKPFDEHYEIRTLKNGNHVRVVSQKTPISVVLRLQGTRGGPFIPRGPRPDPPEPPPPTPPAEPRLEPPPQVPFRTAYIQ